MLLRILPLFILLISGDIYAYEPQLEIIEYIDDIKVVAFVKESDINKTMEWVPFEGTLPLTLESALKSVQEYMASQPKMSDAILKEIELKRLPQHKKYWHYIVKMKISSNGKKQSSYFIVLMDGKIIPALEEPEMLK
jgi:predicted HTH transcriptional regulator